MSSKTKKQTIYLNTRFRDGGTIQAPNWSLPSNLISNTNDDETLELTIIDVLIPYQVYNIYDYDAAAIPPQPYGQFNGTHQNCTFRLESISFTPAAAPPNAIPQFDFRIDQGNYNVYTLAAWLTNALTTYVSTASALASFAILCTYNFNQMKYEFRLTLDAAEGTIDGGFGISFPNYDFNAGEYTAREILGGNPAAVDYLIVPSVAVYPTQSIDIVGWLQGNVGLPRSLIMKMDLISGNIGRDGQGLGHTTTMANIPINVANGETLTYQNVNDDFNISVPTHYLDQLQMTLTDERGRPVFVNGDWNLSFRIDYIKQDHNTENLLSEMIYLQQLQVMGQKELIESTEPLI